MFYKKKKILYLRLSCLSTLGELRMMWLSSDDLVTLGQPDLSLDTTFPVSVKLHILVTFPHAAYPPAVWKNIYTEVSAAVRPDNRATSFLRQWDSSIHQQHAIFENKYSRTQRTQTLFAFTICVSDHFNTLSLFWLKYLLIAPCTY